MAGLNGLALSGPVLARGPGHERSDFARSFAGVSERLGPTTVRFDRPLPDGLQGTLFRNGPARMVLGDTRYRHWFDGDGMIQSFQMAGDTLVHRGRLVATSKLAAENDAGRFLWSAFGTGLPDARSVRRPDDINPANISVLPAGDELLALWEGGSAWRIDPATLETRGRAVLSDPTDGLPFSAHPKFDPAGRIWNFGYMSGSGKLVLYELDVSGALRRTRLIDAPNAEMVHDFAITERYLVFVLMPLTYQRLAGQEKRGFMDRFGWDAGGVVNVLLVDKATLSIAHQFELAPFFAFHLGNAWEDGQTVRVEVARAPAFHDLMNVITQATEAKRADRLAQHHLTDLKLDLKRRTATIDALPVAGADFPRFDQRFTGLRTSRLFLMRDSRADPGGAFGFNALVSLDRNSAKVRQWVYPARTIAEEHLFVPARGSAESAGWILGTAFDPVRLATSIQVFDASVIEDGPVATATLPYHLPLGLHGQFVPV